MGGNSFSCMVDTRDNNEEITQELDENLRYSMVTGDAAITFRSSMTQGQPDNVLILRYFYDNFNKS